jgi:hypothetical protein
MNGVISNLVIQSDQTTIDAVKALVFLKGKNFCSRFGRLYFGTDR